MELSSSRKGQTPGNPCARENQGWAGMAEAPLFGDYRTCIFPIFSPLGLVVDLLRTGLFLPTLGHPSVLPSPLLPRKPTPFCTLSKMCPHQAQACLAGSIWSESSSSLLFCTKVFSTSYSSQVQVPGVLKTEHKGQKRTFSTLQSVSENLLGEAGP